MEMLEAELLLIRHRQAISKDDARMLRRASALPAEQRSFLVRDG